jgi:hypothetical protein
MPILSVRDFSCIKEATFELRPITVIIGPQASGKSLLSKLMYFFIDLCHDQYGAAERGESYKPFLKSTAKRFLTLFPVSAWGSGTFAISFEVRDLVINITRKKSSSRTSNDVVVTTSPAFEKLYTSYFSAANRITRRPSEDDEPYRDTFSPKLFDLRRSAMRNLIDELGSDYVESQFFIPAGRSFYTNLGKAVAMFEFGSQLDEVTKRFGRRFTSMLDGHRHYYLPEKVPAKTKDFLKSQRLTTEAILGGKLKLGSSEKYLETKDGRVIPFSLMSSGQQELLPLLLALENYTGINADDKDPSVDLLFIEEPEAHLFPAAQSALVLHLATISNFLKSRSRFFITTHSPYVLSTMNNLVKAFSVAERMPNQAGSVNKIITRQSWIAPAALAAFALEDGVLRSIKDTSGLIDGSYLDGISDDISSVFLGLLELEIEDD